MKAVGLYKYLSSDDNESLLDVRIEKPRAQGRDLLVAVKSISVNPVDVKVRSPKDKVEDTPRVLGWDAAGEVVSVGEQVEHYAVGDKVYYAGDITRPGSNSEYQLVDERIVGKMPKTLDYSQAAALPLTGITAWEALFERLGISKSGEDKGKLILIVGGAGGVGSIAIQLAKKVAGLNVIATASRDVSADWAKQQGACQIINHRNPLDEELKAKGVQYVDYILCLNSTQSHWQAMANAIAPQGKICSIVETEPVDLDALKGKSASFVWEFMFTRSMYQTEDMIEQKHLLDELAELVDAGLISSTLKQVLQPINAENLRKAHQIVEAGNMVGKIVIDQWQES